MHSELGGQVDAWLQSSAVVSGGQHAMVLLSIPQYEQMGLALGYAETEALVSNLRLALESELRRQDLVIQANTDTLAFLLPALNGIGHLELALSKVQRICDERLRLEGRPLQLRLCLGAALTPVAHDEGTVLLRRAHAAMIRSRQLGEPVIDQGHALSSVASGWQRHLMMAQALEAGEFEPYFQPKVDSVGRVIGAEALLRWNRPGHDLTMPDDFIPQAEANGLILPLTWYVLKASMARCMTWQRPLTLSVNVPAAALTSDKILLEVQDGLAIFDMPPERLTLEVTESGIMHDSKAVLALLSRLRALGIRISIDDFGTGYSSFAHFRDIPADELKIDRCFVTNMLTSEVDAQIVKSMLELAHNLGLSVVAEGVETAAVASRLTSWGCDQMQGFYFGRPLAESDFRSQFLAPAQVAVRQGA